MTPRSKTITKFYFSHTGWSNLVMPRDYEIVLLGVENLSPCMFVLHEIGAGYEDTSRNFQCVQSFVAVGGDGYEWDYVGSLWIPTTNHHHHLFEQVIDPNE